MKKGTCDRQETVNEQITATAATTTTTTINRVLLSERTTFKEKI